MKRFFIGTILAVLIISILPSIVLSYPSDSSKQHIQQMLNRGNPLRSTYEENVDIYAGAYNDWVEAGKPGNGPIWADAWNRWYDKEDAKKDLQANRDSVIHLVDSVYDTGIPAGTDIKYEPECTARGLNYGTCEIRICEPGFAGGPDRLAATKIHEWEHQKQKADSSWPGYWPADTTFLHAKYEFEADEAILNADNGNKIKLTIDQKLEILIRKAGHLKHMLDALEAEWKAKSTGALPGGVVREEVTVTNHSDYPQVIHCTIDDSLGWPIMPQMFTIPLNPEQESIITVFVQVPLSAEIGTINELFCNAYTEDDTSFDFTMINIVPTVEVIAGPDTHGLRGQIIEVPFTVINRGLFPDVYVVEVTNPLGWPVESLFDVYLDVGCDSTFTIPITIPMETPFWTTNMIACKATSFYEPINHDKAWTAIRVDELDIRPLFIQSPIGTYPAGSAVTPKVTVFNNGYVESFFDVYFEVNLPELHRDSVLNLMLPPNHTIDVEFAYINLPQAGLYPLEFYTHAVGDANPYNDTIRGTFTVEDMVTSVWAQKESMPTGVTGKYVKHGGALTSDGTNLYAFRGNKSNEFYKYIPTEDTWVTKESIPFGKKPTDTMKINKKRIGKGASLCWDGANTIYATKGNGTCEFFAYDLTSGIWTAKAFVPSLKGLKGGTSIRWYNGKVYLLAGGQKKDITIDNFFVYTPEGDSDLGTPWTPLCKLPLGPDTKNWKDGSSIVELGGTIYAIHGGTKTNLFYAYDWITNTWLDKEPIPIEDSSYHKYKKKLLVKDGAASASGNGVIYVIKGGGTEVFWKYTPTADVGWDRLDRIPIEKADKKHAPKTGAAMAYADGKVWLLVGNKQVDYWCYTPGAKILTQVNNSTISSVMTEKNLTVLKFSLDVKPNPFTKHTTVHYTVPISGKISLKLYNSIGRLIEIVNDIYLNAGIYTSTLSTKSLAKGIYFLKYEDNTNQKEIKLIVE